MSQIIEVLCHECGYNRFKVIKPCEELPYDSLYYRCRECVRGSAKNFNASRLIARLDGMEWEKNNEKEK